LFASSHPHAITFVNLALGTNVSVFNISIVPIFNQTGNGTFCLDRIPLDDQKLGIEEGDNASLQVIMIGESGSALYNCADITFSKNATLLNSTMCANSTGVGGVELENAGSKGNLSSTSCASNSSSSGAGGNMRIEAAVVVGAAVVGLAVLI
jgi:hypothetical protein